MTVVIDGVTYDVPITKLERRTEQLFKFGERTEDGVLHTEPLGSYVNYEISFGASTNNVSDYAALFLKVSESVSSHSITLLGSTFNAYFAGVKDEVIRDDGVNRYFRSLSFSVICISPTYTP